MDFNQERYFFLSGLISISFFMSLLFITGYSVIIAPKTEQFAMIKSDVINVSIAISESTATEQPAIETAVADEISEPVPEEEKVAKVEPVPDISDLFSQVKPEKVDKKKKDDTARREELNALEKDLLNQKENSRFVEKVNKVELAKPSVKMVSQGGSSGPIVNEYHAKIQGLVYTYFRPPSGSAGEVARVRMNISASGKLISYKVIRYSGNGVFNGEVDWLKDRLSTIRFPEHPEGKEAVLEFILTAKE
ncbi:MAG: TonB C-terminal domain-containing protein [Sulfuricurvum sp.]|uniref:TonB C-terminal domain-containing protein n=1 Tax=Sulfuricurvum sp. TaxID=2025608 RepID=UPI0025D16C01|nr:TonB C-terminal domain-containing protein [Sulfuricurvum sp.]MBV5321790.1 TonB C-terminal domain-containing protein [Sulfuricurvum sp.]